MQGAGQDADGVRVTAAVGDSMGGVAELPAGPASAGRGEPCVQGGGGDPAMVAVESGGEAQADGGVNAGDGADGAWAVVLDAGRAERERRCSSWLELTTPVIRPASPGGISEAPVSLLPSLIRMGCTGEQAR